MTFEAADRLMDTFGYANAAAMRTDAGIPADAMYRALNSNLDAGCPTILSIFGFKRSDAHAIVCDGYAYQYGTAYHHVNMGWGGRRDAWYVLPIIEILNDKDELAFTYTSLYGIVYNIFPEGGHGEIVSGRVLDKEGSPVAGAEVYMVGGSYSKTAKSNESGIFAFKNVPSNTTLTLSATLGNRRFTAHGTARTGKSSLVDADSETWYEFDLGNVWGVELSETDYVYSGGGSGCSATSGLFVLVLAASALIYRRR